MPRHIDFTANGKGYRILIEEACFKHPAGAKIYLFLRQTPDYVDIWETTEDVSDEEEAHWVDQARLYAQKHALGG